MTGPALVLQPEPSVRRCLLALGLSVLIVIGWQPIFWADALTHAPALLVLADYLLCGVIAAAAARLVLHSRRTFAVPLALLVCGGVGVALLGSGLGSGH
jgi:hypothetical protein